jgi:dTDP-4-dehydrorhamnose 3,5-epimerase
LGEVFDVVVDLRKSSSTFGRWIGEYLSDKNKRMLWVPPGFAHAFMVTSEIAEFQYKCTEFYAPEHERCIRWDDTDLAIDWPQVGNVLTSAKDEQGSSFRESDCFH